MSYLNRRADKGNGRNLSATDGGHLLLETVSALEDLQSSSSCILLAMTDTQTDFLFTNRCTG